MKKSLLGNKIIILGCSGSGKSTLARELAEIVQLPLVHLDNVWWTEERTHISRDEFDKKLNDILQSPSWIIDGDYSRTYKVRIQSCDVIIFLDYSLQTCMQGITERVGKKRDDIPWVENKLDDELVKMVNEYQDNQRLQLYELFKQYPEKKVMIFYTREEAKKWLNSLREECLFGN